MLFPSILKFICKLLLSKKEIEHLHNFQKTYRPTMSVVGRGTFIMSIDDAHAARMEKIEKN